jgi:fucose permease
LLICKRELTIVVPGGACWWRDRKQETDLAMQQKHVQTERRDLSLPSNPGGRIPSAPTRLPNKWAILVTLAIGIFMATLDTSIVNISLPTIAHSFHVPLGGEIEWVIIAYLVVIAGVLLTIGRLADMTGRKRLLVLGLIVFTLGSAMCGVAPTLLILILARAFQGLCR